MAPSTKRTAVAQGPGAAKKRGRTAKPDPATQLCETIAQGLEMTDLPDATRRMLVAMLPFSLATPKGERHAHQENVAGMVEVALKGVETRLADKLAVLQSDLDATTSEKENLEQNKQELSTALTDKLKVVEGRRTEQGEREAEHTAALEAVVAAGKVQVEAKESLQKAAEQKSRCSTVASEHLKMIAEGAWDTEQEAKTHVDVLVVFGRQIGVDESLLQGLPQAAMKKPADRGPFDGVIVEQFVEKLRDHESSLDAALGASEKTTAEHIEKVKTAEAEVEAAGTRVQEARAAVAAAEADAEEVTAQRQAADKALREGNQRLRQARDAHTRADAELESFRAAYLSKLASTEALAAALATEEATAAAE